ncbi:hypothetical protein [Micromonospora echinaurantiaca]|uniref:hypothetical protein n=1 Tax=Micromonospora echinaurantiaca TaxID=47857 RepID=UPI00343E22D2
MAFRTWSRLLLTALGVSLLAGAGQLGLAYGFGLLRLTGTFTGVTVNQWPAQLVWVAWCAANAAVVGAVLTERVARRDGALTGTGRQLAVAAAAALGATVVAPLCMQPARAAELISVDPVWAVGICAVLGAVVGAGAALAVLLKPPVGWNMAAVAGALWLLALLSAVPSFSATGALPLVRLGVFEPAWLDADAAQRLAMLVLPTTALLAGAVSGALARWRGHPPLVAGATGVAGPVLVAFAYLTAGPGDAVDRYQLAPYYGALLAVAAGALGSAAAALARRPSGGSVAAPQAIEPTDILRPLPAGPPLPGARPSESGADRTDPTDRAAEPGDAEVAGADLAASAGPGTMGTVSGAAAAGRTTPAHWDWPAAGATGFPPRSPGDAPNTTAGLTADRAGAGAPTPAPRPAHPVEPARAGTHEQPAVEPTAATAPNAFPAPPVESADPGAAPGAPAGPNRGAVRSHPVHAADPAHPADPARPADPATTTPGGASRSTAASAPPAADAASGNLSSTSTRADATPARDAAPGTLSSTSTRADATPARDAATTASGDAASGTAAARSAGAGAPPEPVPTDDAAEQPGGTGRSRKGRSSRSTAASATGRSARRATKAEEPAAAESTDEDAGAATPAEPAPRPRRTRKSKATTKRADPTDPTAEPATTGDPSAPTSARDSASTDPAPSGTTTGSTPGSASTVAAPAAGAASTGSVPAAEAAGTADPATSGSDAGRTRVTGIEPAPTAAWASATEPATGTADPAAASTPPAAGDAPAAGKRREGTREPARPVLKPVPAPVTPTADRPAAPRSTWPVAPAWSAPARPTPTARDEATGPAVPEETSGHRPRHRAPLPDLERAASWEALATARRAGPTAPAEAASEGPADGEDGTPGGAAAGATEQNGGRLRGRLGLFRRNRARTTDEGGSGEAEAEPLAEQDEEYVDWVAGLGRPLADNEPEQESGRRSLRSTGRHHRD